MENPDRSLRWRLLIEALAVLAAEAADQQEWVRRHGVSAEEPALDFDHALGLAQVLAREGRLDEDTMAELRLVDSVFAEMSAARDTACWCPEAFSVDDGWARARGIARAVLVRINGEWRLPLPDITVIR
ncbi:hypothetical protein [Yinghuangia soli]|uniref:Uncharacterized protein n=1 Tax=Yinghuangia soli TaxID=2908204 RepID=A0AA41QA60_9ACTN|nr:hypothetical protein [Yinghuangia soli]MCF2533199.1 hypothetical protein [Yinghuangia soli]